MKLKMKKTKKKKIRPKKWKHFNILVATRNEFAHPKKDATIAKSPRTDVEYPSKGPTRGSGEPPEGLPKNPGRGKFFLQSLLKGPTRGSENFAQNVGPWGGTLL